MLCKRLWSSNIESWRDKMYNLVLQWCILLSNYNYSTEDIDNFLCLYPIVYKKKMLRAYFAFSSIKLYLGSWYFRETIFQLFKLGFQKQYFLDLALSIYYNYNIGMVNNITFCNFFMVYEWYSLRKRSFFENLRVSLLLYFQFKHWLLLHSLISNIKNKMYLMGLQSTNTNVTNFVINIIIDNTF